MKRLILLTLIFAMLLSLAACFDVPEESTTQKSTTTAKPTTSTTTSNSGGGNIDPDIEQFLKEAKGLNEQIVVTIDGAYSGEYEVYYKKTTDDEYTRLDSNLIMEKDGIITAYILGISEGLYTVEVKALGLGSNVADNICVTAQDRSGYAHFGATEGVGAYNNDGTVKSGTKIIYVTNENKNTVTCEINGETYIGLVNILQAQYKSGTPMLVRIIGKITTNQWNYKNVEPRLADGSNATNDFFVNTFSTEYGENLANLIVKMKGNGGGAKTYNYRTTPTGLTDVRETNGGTSTVNYKGSDFPSLKGMTVYDDDSYYNMLEVKGSKNITIEGVGADAEIFQFGIGFEESSSIEIKNLTFTDYPEDALNFMGGDREDLAQYGRYWIHNCTFNRGYNSWDISGERDKYAGDGSIDFNNVSYTTLAYNKFDSCKKTMLFGSGDSSACLNMTMHHNYFYKVDSRLPLGRNSNIHTYNNYFDQCKSCASLRSSSYQFSENNYYKSCTTPFYLASSYVKSFGDVFESSSKGSITVVTDRTQTVTSTCKPDKSTNYANFDTNSALFYYDSENQKSDVSIMLDAEEVPTFVEKHAGAGKFVALKSEN